MANNNSQLPFSREQAMAFAASPAGKQLIALLQSRNGVDISRVQELAAAGNMEQAKAELSSLLSDPKIKEFMKQFGG